VANKLALRAASAKWRKKHPDKVKAASLRYYSRHKEKLNAQSRVYYSGHKERAKITQRAWRKANADSQRAYKRKRDYGTDGAHLWLLQNGLCAICRVDLSTLTTQNQHLDHNHITGKVRGWLCRVCNLALGQFKDDPALVRAALNYLDSYELV